MRTESNQTLLYFEGKYLLYSCFLAFVHFYAMKPDFDHVRNILINTISLCKNSLSYSSHLKVQGLLGITLDEEEVFLVEISEQFYQKDCASSSSLNDNDVHHVSRRKDNRAAEFVVTKDLNLTALSALRRHQKKKRLRTRTMKVLFGERLESDVDGLNEIMIKVEEKLKEDDNRMVKEKDDDQNQDVNNRHQNSDFENRLSYINAVNISSIVKV